MLRGPIADQGFRGQFSGHETFPLRYGWLNKVFDAVNASSTKKSASLFARDDAIISFGVGKNMVTSLKYWGLAAGVLEEADGKFRTTELAEYLMGPRGADPFLESPASLWLIHWRLAGTPSRTTTWFWAFNHYAGQAFDRDILTADLVKLCQDRGWGRGSAATIRRDVECFIRTYVRSGRGPSDILTEDSLECPLAELSLIQATGYRGTYQFLRGSKPTLPDAVFAFALAEFWNRFTTANSLSIEAITYEPGSPGRVFKLDEESVADRLSRIGAASAGLFQWTDTAGVRQVLRKKRLSTPLALLRIARRAARPSRRARLT